MVMVRMGFLAGHAAIYGARLSVAIGLLLSETGDDHEALEDKLEGIVSSFLAPVFFPRLGTQVERRHLGLPTLDIAGHFLGEALGPKAPGTLLATRILQQGLGHLGASLFNSRPTFGIIRAMADLQEGLVDRRLFSATLLVALASSPLLIVLLRALSSELFG